MINNLELEKAQTFVEANIAPAREGRRCIDGRYKTDIGMIARPGADFGYAMVMLRLNRTLNLAMSPGQCFDAIYNAVTADDGYFYMHTHCSHIDNSRIDILASDYDLISGEVESVLEYASTKRSQGARIKVVHLDGEHQEQGLLVNLSTEKTIKPQDGKSMYFVYDKTRDLVFINEVIIPNLGIKGVTSENFQEISQMHLMATVNILAKDKPAFAVNVDGASPAIRQL